MEPTGSVPANDRAGFRPAPSVSVIAAVVVLVLTAVAPEDAWVKQVLVLIADNDANLYGSS